MAEFTRWADANGLSVASGGSGGGGGGTNRGAVGTRVTRRQSGPPKVYSLKPREALELLKNQEGWNYVEIHGEWKIEGPDEGDGPFAEAEVRARGRMVRKGWTYFVL